MRKLGDEKVGLPTLTCRLWGPEQVVFVLFCFLARADVQPDTDSFCQEQRPWLYNTA